MKDNLDWGKTEHGLKDNKINISRIQTEETEKDETLIKI